MFDPALDMSLRTSLSPGALWVAIVDPRHLRRWWPEAAIEPREGGAIEADELPFKKKKTRHAAGRIERIDPGSYLRFAWRSKGRDATTRVEVHVSQSKSRSKVRIVESGFDRHDYSGVEVERMRDFWRERLGDLKDYAERPKHAAELEEAARRAAQ